MKKYLLTVSVLMLMLMGCRKDVPYLSPNNSLLTFQFLAAQNIEDVANDIVCDVQDTLVVGVTGNMNNRTDLIATFTTSGESVTVNGIIQTSGITINDFSKPVMYTVTADNGSQRSYAVKLKSFTGLPVLYLTTEADITSKEDYVNGTMKIDGNFDFTEGLYDGNIQIRGRGNSTWGQPKNPYKIKLPSKAKILGMPSDKEWALLANYFDKSLLRNDVAFELSEKMGISWTPRRRFVEVFINGNYNGNYLLTETVKIGKDRLNISGMKTDNASDTTGGFLVEADWQMNAAQTWISNSQVRMSLKEPEPLTAVQFDYVRNKFQRMEDAISNYQDIRGQIDLDSWIKWVIVNEVMRKADGALYGSCFFYNNAAGKIAMGPVWDFDLGGGSYGENPEDWFINTANWIGGMFYYHPYYKQRYKEIWLEKRTEIISIISFAQKEADLLRYSQVENYKKWDTMAKSLYGGQAVAGSYQGELDLLKTFLDKRIKWMDAEISKW